MMTFLDITLVFMDILMTNLTKTKFHYKYVKSILHLFIIHPSTPSLLASTCLSA